MLSAARIAVAVALVLAADAVADDDETSDPMFGGFHQSTNATCAYVGAGAHRWRFKVRAYCGTREDPPPALPFVLGQDGIGVQVGGSDVLAVAPTDPRLTVKRNVVTYRPRAAVVARTSAGIRAVALDTQTGALRALVDFRGSIAETLSGEWSVPMTVTVGADQFTTTIDFAASSNGRRWVRRPDADKRVEVVVSGDTALLREEFVLRDDAACADAWRRNAAAPSDAVPPSVDFSRDMVVGVTGPMWGLPFWIEGVDRAIVHVRHGIVWGCGTYELPWQGIFVRVPTTTLPVEFDHRMRWISCPVPESPTYLELSSPPKKRRKQP